MTERTITTESGGKQGIRGEQTPSRARRTQKRLEQYTRGGPVTIRRPDGTTTVEPALTDTELARIDARSARAPRTWNEINSSMGGGLDHSWKR